MKKLLLILLCLPMISFGQCDPVDGCENGYATYIWSNGAKYVGEFKNYKRDGEGLFTYETDTFSIIYDGEYKAGKKDGKGQYTEKNNKENYIITYNGEYKNDKKDGKGIFTYETDTFSIIYDGEYKDNKRFNGTQEQSHKDNGVIIYTVYKEFEIINTTDNTNNTYSIEDIIGNSVSTTVKLERCEKDHFWIKMMINNIECEWIFDSGASDFSISAEQWGNLKDIIKYRDLNYDRKSIGVLGIESNNKTIIIDEISLGDFKVKNVVASVRYKNENQKGDFALMGVGFFDKFSNVKWNMNNASLTFYK